MMTLSKQDAIVMQSPWKMEEESQTNSESNSSFNGDYGRHWDEKMHINITAGESVPTISFKSAEENTIELLVVVTRKMHLILKGRLTEYLVATIGSVAQSFKHSSLKASVKVGIVDIILLDSNFARREGLEDWSNKNHEEVMGKFCQWVNRIRRPTMNWDSAILLNVGNFKTTALGVAHYQAMCNQQSSCLVVVDRGFGTADIIAHEIGHQLGAKHDFEVGSDCGLEEQPGRKKIAQQLSRRTPDTNDLTIQRDTVMSGILYFELYPFRWSACSRQNIQFFLSRPDSSCLRIQNSQRMAFTPEQLTEHTVQHKPGLRFTLNEQCALALRQQGARFCGHTSPVCKQLNCYDEQRGMCLPVEAPWAEGSRCGYKKWCVMGQCLPQGDTIPPVDGGWSAWEEWGICSRSCGGGVQFSHRECTNPEPQNGGQHCLGTNVRVRSCNVQDCLELVDIRQHLCDMVGQRYNKNLQAFRPSIGGTNACRLVCLDGTKEMKHNESLPDGIPCHASATDICIKGKCWQAGCDKVLGSQMQRDNCNVCGGDNSTCYAVSGEFHHSDSLSPGAKPVGLTIAVHIPQGVTNAYIKKVSRRSTPYSADAYDDFMLLIFEELKTRIRRGETREPFAGAELFYSGSRDKEEIVYIKGQINKNVNILIRAENKNTKLPLPDVEYTYYMSKDASYHLRFDSSGLAEYHYNDPLLRFLRSPRKETPAEGPSYENAESSSNLQLPKSEYSSQAAEAPVRFEWKMDEVPKECTSCSGIVESHATCYPVFSSQEATKSYEMHPLPLRYCSESSRPAPVSRNCIDYCGLQWSWREVNTSVYTFPRSSCSERCGEGLSEVRFTAVCEEKIHRNNTPYTTWSESSLGASACIKAELGEPPEDRIVTSRCTGDCRSLQWVFSDWHECSKLCGVGTRQRTVMCVDSGGIHWPLNECLQHLSTPSKDSPDRLDSYIGTETDKCFEMSGCDGQFTWITSPWSECRTTAAQGDMGSLCQSTMKRHFNTGAQGLLNDAVFTGFQTRTVKCFLHPNNDENIQLEAPQHYCQRANAVKPPEQQICIAEFTCYRWTAVHFSQCSTTCGAGQRVGQISCEQVNTRGAGNTVTLLSETECFHRLGSNISLRIDSRREEPMVYIVENNSSEDLEVLQRAPYLHSLPYTIGQPIILACSNAPCRSRNLKWVPGDWSTCSVTCGMGFLQRSIRCLLMERHNDGVTTSEVMVEEAPESECTARGLVRPVDMQLCEAPPCVKWSADEWSECKGTCESGTQERHIRCYRQGSPYQSSPESITWHSSEVPPDVSSMMVGQEVKPEECESQSKPADKRACLLASDCPFWYQSPWSSCSATCGVGTRFRHVDCRFPNGTILYVFNWISRDRNMLEPKFLTRRRQNYIPRPKEHFKSMRCLGPRPVDKTECQPGLCLENRPFWWPIASSTCHAHDCHRSYQERHLQCLTPSFQQVDPNECAYSRKPLKHIPCTLKECKVYRWRTDTWAICPYACGRHTRYRSVRCVDDLGEEYADHLCQAHLRPDSWGVCPDFCPDFPISCWDQKQRHPSSNDGVYDLAVHRKVVKIYCSDMESSYPREYLPLHHLNYASIHHFAETREQNCSLTNIYHDGKVTDTDDTFNASYEKQFQRQSELQSESVTVFNKLSIDLNTLEVDIFDGLFSETRGKQFVPYASAKSCSRCSSELGKIVINLEGTGFVVSRETQWRASRVKSFGHVVRMGGSKVIMGTCGGDCGGCWPDPALKLEAIDAEAR